MNPSTLHQMNMRQGNKQLKTNMSRTNFANLLMDKKILQRFVSPNRYEMNGIAVAIQAYKLAKKTFPDNLITLENTIDNGSGTWILTID